MAFRLCLGHRAQDVQRSGFGVVPAMPHLLRDDLRTAFDLDLPTSVRRHPIDFDALTWQRPTMSFDPPAGGARQLQRARRCAATIVFAEMVYPDRQATGDLPGRLLRWWALSG